MWTDGHRDSDDDDDEDAIRHHQTRDLISNASITTTSCSFSLAGHRRRSTTDGFPPRVRRARVTLGPPGRRPPAPARPPALGLGLPLGPSAAAVFVRRLSVADRTSKSVLSADARIKIKESPTAPRTTTTAAPNSGPRHSNKFTCVAVSPVKHRLVRPLCPATKDDG